MTDIDLPLGLERFRSKLEATVKSYVEIQTHLTRKTNLWQSKFAGFPYLPKKFDYPKTPEGDYLYLLAQINFEEVPRLEKFPENGILQFYSSRDLYYGLDLDNPTSQAGFRIIYFPNPDLNEDNLITNFDFLPTLWDWDKDSIPFYICHSYNPYRDDCFALTFSLKSAPISASDYKLGELVGTEICDMFAEDEYSSLWEEYQERFAFGHRLGGYPFFTQSDPREFLTEEEDPYMLLQIDTDSSACEKIYIEWGDSGVCNFFIRESALKKLDFSQVLYNWDCG